MKCVAIHESSTRLRVRTPLIHMTMRQADLLEYFISSIPEVHEAKVDERTGNATIVFCDGCCDKIGVLNAALADYDETSDAVTALVPEETGRALNREYQQKLMFQVLKHFGIRLFVPVPIRTARTIVKSIPFAYKAIKSAARGKLNVELLDGVAIAASILRKDYATAASVMFMLDTGEILEDWTRKKSIGDLARSMTLNVDQVWLKTDEGEVMISVNEVEAGDHVIVRSSDIIPLDGKVISGTMTVNQSTMTGESEPVMKEEGGYVYAGTVVEEGECLIEVTRTSGTGKYDQIVRMIEESEKLKSETEARAYRLADRLVPYSFIGFAATFALTRNVTKALSFLMVDYSCAMKLSMPLSVLSAIREARDYGISIKGGKFMELVSEADTIVFDKTGTLTYASPKLVDVVTFGDHEYEEVLRIAACLEEHYPHSVANAIVDAALEKGIRHDELHSKVEYIVAHGVSSSLEDKKAVIGSEHFVLEDEACAIPEGEADKINAIPEEYSRIYLAIDGQLIAILCIFDPVREEAAAVIDQLHDLGITSVCMMTGDNAKTARTVAAQLGLDEYQAEVLPEDKAMYIRRKRSEGHKVLMVGDGVNDSPALSEADAGIAVESGAAIAREIADITISSEDLQAIVTLRKLSRALMNRIQNNYHFIVGFNSALIALGIGGILPPATSALLHNGSTIMTGIKSTTNLLNED